MLVNSKKEWYMPLDLQWFAKDGEGGEKTEEPTAKKLTDARNDGKVAKSRELDNAVGLLLLFVTLSHKRCSTTILETYSCFPKDFLLVEGL